jgi:chromosome segregation ATPase
MPRAIALTAVLAAGLLGSACGDDSVEVDDYANDLCTALKGWTQDLRDSQAELQAQATPDASLESDRDALEQFVADAVAATDDLTQELEDAGEPDIDGGGDVSDAFQEALDDTRGQLEEAQDKVAQIPADNPQDYRAAVDEFLTNLRSTLEGIDEHFADVDAPDLDRALDDASACQG